MTHIVLIRGAPAVGKTTISKKLLLKLKNENNLNCAYICEDDFRKQMQFKYKAQDLKCHENSAILIQNAILKLLEIDSYDIIIIDGQFRYKNIVEQYEVFFKSNGFKSTIFQLELDFKTMVQRDKTLRNTKSKDIELVLQDIDSFTPKDTIKINTTQPIEESLNQIIDILNHPNEHSE